jgi:stearoyl-CoA desaturase (Delta-9 desaturase)
MSFPLPLLVFFVLHWQLSVFFQSFFLHRYAAHRMFTMSRGWERFFHLCTYVLQGSSYLKPDAYAILHRTHHAYSDEPGDPHSPKQHKTLLRMLLATKRNFEDISQRGIIPEPRFAGNVPVWKALDAWGSSRASGLMWIGIYTSVYAWLATEWWHFALLPFHFVMGPMHGTIVNWFGHWAGYRNYDTDDRSRNTLIVDVLTCGELFQNNHHRFPADPNFAKRWFELDPTYPVIRIFHWLGIIHSRKAPAATSLPEQTAPRPPLALSPAAAASSAHTAETPAPLRQSATPAAL